MGGYLLSPLNTPLGNFNLFWGTRGEAGGGAGVSDKESDASGREYDDDVDDDSGAPVLPTASSGSYSSGSNAMLGDQRFGDPYAMYAAVSGTAVLDQTSAPVSESS